MIYLGGLGCSMVIPLHKEKRKKNKKIDMMDMKNDQVMDGIKVYHEF